MDFRLMGPFEVWHDDRRVKVRVGQQLQVLIALLLQANRPVTHHRLVEIICDNPADRKPKNVVSHISRLNSTFRSEGATDVYIESVGKGPTAYVLHVPPRQVDYLWFDQLRERARRHLADGDSVSARKDLHEALGLYRGGFLADQDDIDRTSRRIRQELALGSISVLGDLAELELAAGNHRWVRDRLLTVVLRNPLRQRLTALLMEALLRDDDPEQAVAMYHRTKDALDRSGIQTSQRLKELMWRAKYGRARTSLPTVPPELIGRDDELAAIATAAWRAPRKPGGPEIVWISGMPGVGKTAVAVHGAYREAKAFRHARLYIDLHGFTPNVTPTTPGEALDQLLRQLGVPAGDIPPTVEGKADRYQAWLEGTQSLIVLDNAESERHIERLLPASPGSLVIVTSRHLGGPRANTRIHLDPLQMPQAVRLFFNIVGRDPAHEEWSLVEEIVRCCGQVPLLIRVVAIQLLQHPTWSVDHLLHSLREHSPLLLDSDAVDETGDAACAVSYRQLTEPQRMLFRHVGLSPCPELDAFGAAALVGTPARQARGMLETLHRVSLLEEVSPERYQMPDLLRAYAASLAADDRPDDVPARLRPLLDYYLATTAAAMAAAFPFDRDRQPEVHTATVHRPRFAGYSDALHWLSAEHPNLLAIIRYAAGLGLREFIWRLAVLLWRYFNVTGHLQDWSATLELALSVVTAEPPDRRGTAEVLLWLSGARWSMGELEPALELAGRSLQSWTALGHVRGEADALCAMALPAKDLGRYEPAREYLEAALTRYERLEDRRGQATALDNLGDLYGRQRQFDAAVEFHQRAYALLVQIGHRFGQMHSRDNLGSIRQKLGQLDEAIADHRAALALAADLGDQASQAYASNNLANALRRKGRPDEATGLHNEALAIASRIGNRNLRADAHNDLGETCLARGAHDEAVKNHRAALDLAGETGDPRQHARAEVGIARALHAQGDHDHAGPHWRAAVARHRDLNPAEAEAIAGEREALSCACAVIK